MNSLGGDEKMTSRERVLTTMSNQEPDRVPINYAANPGIDAKLKQHFGLAPDDAEGLMEVLGVDFRMLLPPYAGPRLHEQVPDRNVEPAWGVHTRWVEHGSGGYWDFCDFPLRYADEEMVANWPMPSPDDYSYDFIETWCNDRADRAIYVGNPGIGDIINTSGMIRNMEQVLIDLIVGDPAWRLWIDRKHAIDLEVLERTIEATKGHASFMWLGEDLGTQDSPMISMDIFRREIRPRHQKFIDLAKAYDLPVMIHTCGSSSWAYEDFIEMGMNGVDTLQPEAKNMSPAYLKEHFGGRLFFHGCISTTGSVTFGTPADVEDECRQTLDTMMPGGGYCFAPAHALQDNSPLENVLKMYEMPRTHGRYK